MKMNGTGTLLYANKMRLEGKVRGAVRGYLRPLMRVYSFFLLSYGCAVGERATVGQMHALAECDEEAEG